MNLLDSGVTLNCYMDRFVYIKPNEIKKFINADYHIYFICSLPKSYFIETSIDFNSSSFSCEITDGKTKTKIPTVYLDIFDGSMISGTTYKLSNDKSTITLSYYKNFVKQNDVVLSANEAYGQSGLMKKKQEKLLYIGQAYAKTGKRTAGMRLDNHSTLQKILSDIQAAGGDEVVQLYLLNFKMEQILQLAATSTINKNIEIANRFISTMNSYTHEMCIDLVEASLINYFKPDYNTQYIKKGVSKASKKFKIFYDNKISRISVQIIPTTYSDELLKAMNIRMPEIVFYTNSQSFSTSSMATIVSDLNDELCSTFVQLQTLK